MSAPSPGVATTVNVDNQKYDQTVGTAPQVDFNANGTPVATQTIPTPTNITPGKPK
jgi:hypothetical protein